MSSSAHICRGGSGSQSSIGTVGVAAGRGPALPVGANATDAATPDVEPQFPLAERGGDILPGSSVFEKVDPFHEQLRQQADTVPLVGTGEQQDDADARINESRYISPTLGPKVYRLYLIWAVWISRVRCHRRQTSLQKPLRGRPAAFLREELLRCDSHTPGSCEPWPILLI